MEFSAAIVHYLYRIFFVLVLAFLVYVGAKAVRKFFNVYQEVLVMCSVTFGRRWMPKAKSLRIQPYLCRTADLDDVSINECYKFHGDAFRVADENLTDEEVFVKYRLVLMSYTYILFYREKLDGSLRGLALIGVDHRGPHTFVKVGLMLTEKNYRGGPWFRLLLTCLIIRELILNPFVPVYYFGKVSTYKSYLMGTPFPDSHPRYNKPAPEEYKRVAEDFVRSINSPLEDYNRDTFVLRRRVGVVKETLAPISERDLQNPHIRFFSEQNPGWREGDQLLTMVKMTWFAVLGTMVVVLLRQFKQPSAIKGSNVPRGNAAEGNINRVKLRRLQKRLNRGFTYQDMEAALHSVRYHSEHWEEEEDNEGENGARGRGRGGGQGGDNKKRINSFIGRLYSHSDDEDFNVNL